MLTLGYVQICKSVFKHLFNHIACLEMLFPTFDQRWIKTGVRRELDETYTQINYNFEQHQTVTWYLKEISPTMDLSTAVNVIKLLSFL